MDERFDRALGASYRLVERIGQGASGEVWSALDTRTNQTVAAKLLRPEHASNQALVTRFIAERAILLELRHPNIVAVRDLVVEGDRLAIVMDYMDGGSLRDLIRRERTLPPTDATGIAISVLDALTAAHAKKILHRDIKPDNVLLNHDWRGSEGVKLTDFGIARMLAEQPHVTTGLVGTPEYMSPELLTTGHCDLPADIYGVGILLYELLAGRTPYAGAEQDLAVAFRHVNSTPPRIDVPPRFWGFIMTLLDKSPTARPTAGMAAAALRQLRPSLNGLPALVPTAAPDTYEEDNHPATMLSAIPSLAEAEPSVPETPIPELGEAPQGTVLRPMPVRPQSAVIAEPEIDSPDAIPPWKNPKMIAAIIGVVIIVAAAIAFAVLHKPAATPNPTATQSAITVTQQDQPTVTGLTVSRQATWDPTTHQASLTLTYTAQNAPLAGPFLEILPAPSSGQACPAVTWPESDQQRNLPSKTGITTACGWAVTPPALPAQGSQTVTATIDLPLPGTDAQSELQQWLDNAAAQTTQAVSDQKPSTTAYPVQRLQGVELKTPGQVVSQTTLSITVLPVWPSGADDLNPLYKSPAVGKQTTTLTAIAGTQHPLRFSDSCSGAIAISSDGLTATALSPTDSCTITAQVGNLTNIDSDSFAITTRGK